MELVKQQNQQTNRTSEPAELFNQKKLVNQLNQRTNRTKKPTKLKNQTTNGPNRTTSTIRTVKLLDPFTGGIYYTHDVVVRSYTECNP